MVTPRAGFELNAEKIIAFAMAQDDAISTCVSVGLGQSFGLIGGREYYAANSRISEATVGEALRRLSGQRQEA
jgi:hypothetical protein